MIDPEGGPRAKRKPYSPSRRWWATALAASTPSTRAIRLPLSLVVKGHGPMSTPAELARLDLERKRVGLEKRLALGDGMPERGRQWLR